MAGGGKVIWELSCLEFDPIIENTPRVLLSVCIDLYNEYVLPADTEIKKNKRIIRWTQGKSDTATL